MWTCQLRKSRLLWAVNDASGAGQPLHPVMVPHRGHRGRAPALKRRMSCRFSGTRIPGGLHGPGRVETADNFERSELTGSTAKRSRRRQNYSRNVAAPGLADDDDPAPEVGR